MVPPIQCEVSANIRMLVVRLQDGKLWVCGPIAPTTECLKLLDELGEVGHLVVPGTALEHKSSLADFSRTSDSLKKHGFLMGFVCFC